MFAKNKILSMNDTVVKASRYPILANNNLSGSGGGQNSGYRTSVSTYLNSQYNYYMSGLIPATPELTDFSSLALFYRDMYLHDNIAGSCVDIQSSFPFSDWELRGVDEKYLDVYNKALERLSIKDLLPQLSTSFMTDGFYCGSLIYDASDKNFMDIITYDALSCAVTASPFNNIEPSVKVSYGGNVSNFINSGGEYAQEYIKTMPQEMVRILLEGSFTIDPITSIFFGRRTITDRPYLSYLHRILPMYLIEKSMYRGTLVESNRRQRAITMVSMGSDLWTPTSQELSIMASRLQEAEQDPLGGWLTVREGVSVQDIKQGGEFWKWTEMTDTMTGYKLRALGISEALLSGDASYASAESAYSTFLETVESYRSYLTHRVFYNKIFPLIAVANGFFKDEKESKKIGRSVQKWLYETSNRSKLHLPTLFWHKNLSNKTEEGIMETLQTLQEKTGIIIPLKTWLAAAGVDKETLLKDQKADEEIRDRFIPKKIDGENVGEEGEAPPEESNGQNYYNKSSIIEKLPSSIKHGLRKRKPLLSRQFGENEIRNGTNRKSTGISPNSRARLTDENWRIAKIAVKADGDKEYRKKIRNVSDEVSFKKALGIP